MVKKTRNSKKDDLKTLANLLELGPAKEQRQCGDCSLCCKVMGVPEVKPDHEWCPHAAPGKGGCLIYRSRPERCRDFHCQWLIDRRFPDYWKPHKSKIVIDVKIADGVKMVCFVVDPDYPTRWREKPWIDDIKAMALAGLEGRLGEKWQTVVSIRGDHVTVRK